MDLERREPALFEQRRDRLAAESLPVREGQQIVVGEKGHGQPVSSVIETSSPASVEFAVGHPNHENSLGNEQASRGGDRGSGVVELLERVPDGDRIERFRPRHRFDLAAGHLEAVVARERRRPLVQVHPFEDPAEIARLIIDRAASELVRRLRAHRRLGRNRSG